MIYTELTKRALLLSFEAHREQRDKSEMPYVYHPFHVAEQMKDEDTTVAALLHDVAEDTDITIEDIRKMGFPDRVCDALKRLTHDKSVPYMEYIEGLRSDPIAAAVKLADLEHNSDLSRLDAVDDKALARAGKYKTAMELLKRGSKIT